jgi:hypothetical protein
MADLVKLRGGTGEAASGLMAGLLILVGGLLMIGGCVYRVFIHPEWTFQQAFGALWPFVGVGIVSFVLGWLLDRTPGAQRWPVDAARIGALLVRRRG